MKYQLEQMEFSNTEFDFQFDKCKSILSKYRKMYFNHRPMKKLNKFLDNWEDFNNLKVGSKHELERFAYELWMSLEEFEDNL